jgi:hypothetical protein
LKVAPRPAPRKRRASLAKRWGIGAAAGVVVLLGTFAALAARAPRAAPALNLPSQHPDATQVPAQAEPLAPRIFTPPPPPKPEFTRWETAAPPPAPPADAALSGRHNPAILSRYDQGNVDGAIDVALQEGDDALASRLQKFAKLYRAGKSAMTAHDDAGALRNLTAALAVDKQLAKGRWGRYGPELRSLVAQLRGRQRKAR